MCSIELNETQKQLKDEIQKNLNELRNDLQNNKIPWNDKEKIYFNMAQKAHELHMSLNPKPKHHRYMIENRGMSSDDPEFYYHIHPVEDLLKYLENIHANDDPEDQTLNMKFKLKVYSRRWGHKDTYYLTRNSDGWNVCFNSFNKQCDKQGNDVLYEILEHDYINYPQDIGGYLEFLWDQAESQGLSCEQLQEELSKLGEWISNCELNSPDGIFRGYK